MKQSKSRPRTFAERVLKVNHAGENGAVHIYKGQLVFGRFTAPGMVAELREFRIHEEMHREIFASELQRRGVRRCRSFALCGIGGYVLGLLTGLFGRTAIAATTVAVERVVLAHLREQLRILDGSDAEAAAAISRIVADEQEHHDRSVIHASEGRFWPAALSPLVEISTESVIWLGMRL